MHACMYVCMYVYMYVCMYLNKMSYSFMQIIAQTLEQSWDKGVPSFRPIVSIPSHLNITFRINPRCATWFVCRKLKAKKFLFPHETSENQITAWSLRCRISCVVFFGGGGGGGVGLLKGEFERISNLHGYGPAFSLSFWPPCLNQV